MVAGPSRIKSSAVVLELDGKPAGRLFSVEGGELKTGVTSATIGAQNVTLKHDVALSYEDLTFTCGTGMSRAFYDWLRTTTTKTFVRKAGAIVHLDQGGKPIHRYEFFDALVTAIVTPQLDWASHEKAFLTVKISPTQARHQDPPSAPDLTLYRHGWDKAWHVSSFRLRIDGLETGCARVTRVKPVTFGLKVKSYQDGAQRFPSMCRASRNFRAYRSRFRKHPPKGSTIGLMPR